MLWLKNMWYSFCCHALGIKLVYQHIDKRLERSKEYDKHIALANDFHDEHIAAFREEREQRKETLLLKKREVKALEELVVQNRRLIIQNKESLATPNPT